MCNVKRRKSAQIFSPEVHCVCASIEIQTISNFCKWDSFLHTFFSPSNEQIRSTVKKIGRKYTHNSVCSILASNQIKCRLNKELLDFSWPGFSFLSRIPFGQTEAKCCYFVWATKYNSKCAVFNDLNRTNKSCTHETNCLLLSFNLIEEYEMKWEHHLLAQLKKSQNRIFKLWSKM